MAKKKKTKKKRPKSRRKKALRQVQTIKYKASFAGLVKMLVIEMGAVNKRGEVAWGKIAKTMGVDVRTLRRWRKKSGKADYHEDFDLACREAIEACDAAKIKRSMITRAEGYTQTKKVTEMRETPDGEITVNRTEKTTFAGDPAAAKLVLPNIGPKDERWMGSEKRIHDVTGALGKLLDEIGAEAPGLPDTGDMENDGKGVEAEVEKPVVAPEQSVLDN